MSKIVIFLYPLIMMGLLVFIFYKLLSALSLMDKAKSNLSKLYLEINSRNDVRVKELELKRKIYGTVDGDAKTKRSFFEGILIRIDDTLVYSGMSNKYKWLNSSVYFAASVIVFVIIMLIGLIFFDTVLMVPFAFAALTVFIPWVYMQKKREKNYKLTESKITFFVELVANSAAVSSDMVTVLEDTARFMTEPVRGAIYRAVAYARLTGNPSDATYLLTREIEYPAFCRFIRNLDVCSRNDAQYNVVARDYYKMAYNSVRMSKRLGAIHGNSRRLLLFLIAASIAAIVVICPAVNLELSKLWYLIRFDPVGQIAGTLYSMTILGALYFIFKGD